MTHLLLFVSLCHFAFASIPWSGICLLFSIFFLFFSSWVRVCVGVNVYKILHLFRLLAKWFTLFQNHQNLLCFHIFFLSLVLCLMMKIIDNEISIWLSWTKFVEMLWSFEKLTRHAACYDNNEKNVQAKKQEIQNKKSNFF